MGRPASKAFLEALRKADKRRPPDQTDPPADLVRPHVLIADVREIAIRTLEDQSATFFRGNAVLKMGTAERRKLVEFTADIIASHVAERIRAKEVKRG